jgi:hypothetical protein
MSNDGSRRHNKRSNYSDREREQRPRTNQDQRSSASYKADLDKLFQSGGQVPDRFKGMLDKLKPEEGSPEAERLSAIETLRTAEGFKDFIDAVNAYRKAGHALPDDEDLLTRMLDHPREGVVIEVLHHLIDLQGRRTIHRKAPIKARLETVKTMSEDPSLHELADRLKTMLG